MTGQTHEHAVGGSAQCSRIPSFLGLEIETILVFQIDLGLVNPSPVTVND